MNAEATPPEFSPAPPQAVSSAMADVSSVLGISSLLFLYFTGVPAVLFGLIAMWQIGRSKGRLKGWIPATVGICMGGIMSVGLLIADMLLGLGHPKYQPQASNNARQIIISLKSYAGEHGGHYPDADESHPKTANDVLRLLIKGGYLEDERVFTAPGSFEVADGNLGPPPDFPLAVTKGENHWDDRDRPH